jgi:4-amino-4-deoxy-L-arabinose transferase-like glycosyltransferase/DNA-directed RNA polymerase subunit RPC12/RpoP
MADAARAQAEGTSPPFSFPCGECGKAIEVRAGQADEAIPCPSCGVIVAVPRTGPGAPPPAPARRIPVPPAWAVLGLILLATFLLKLHNLHHTALTHWDEVFHAVVARNLLKHPFEPTLVDVPYLPYDRTKWKETHVWLHKPILPLWQIALAFAALGVNAFALRLPSAVLSTGAAWLTYLIGKELLDRRAALIAAGLQAVNPFLVQLVHGYQFADHVDVALLFWVEVGIYFLTRALRTGSWRDVLLAGVAQGLAYLCKSYLSAIVFGVALTAWLLPFCGLGRREDCRIGPAHLLGLLGATVLTAAPWLVYCLVHYPLEFGHEQAQVWKHVTGDVEGWAAPWDRVAFDYLIAIYGVFYAPVLVAGVVLLGKALPERHTGLALVYAWGLGVVLPHLVVTTKTPSATVLAMPPLLLLLGCLVAEAWRGERRALAALTGVLAMSFVFPAVIKNPGYGPPSPHVFAGVMRHSLWVVGQVAGALAVVAVVAVAGRLSRRRLAAAAGALGPALRVAALVFCACALAWQGIETVRAAWRVTDRDVDDPSCEEVGEFARRSLPDNAVLLCEERRGDEHLTTMFYADRTCYALGRTDPDEMARRVLQAGGVPYVVSRRQLPLAPVHVSDGPGPTVYLWQPPPPGVGRHPGEND